MKKKRTINKIKGLMKRNKFRQFSHWLKSGHAIRQLRIKKYLSTNNLVCLQIGGGRHAIKDWLNADIIAGEIYLNATKKLPFPDESIDFIFAEQFIEHLSYIGGNFFLNEAFRILKYEGVIRVATPNLDGLIDVYKDQNDNVIQEDVISRHRRNHNPQCQNYCHFINDIFHLWGHKFIYNKKTLEETINTAKFKKVEWKIFGKSSYEALKNRERHAL